MKGKIGLANATLSAPFFEGIRQGVMAAAAQLCYEVVAQSADDGTQQTNQVQQMLAQGIQALIYIPSGADAASVPVTDANKLGIPVIAVDRVAPSGEVVTFIAADSVPGAGIVCDYMAKGIKGTGDVIWIEGQIGTTPWEARTQGCNEALAKYPGIKVVAKAPADWDRTKGFNVASDLLQANPTTVGIFGMSDDMAIGAAQASAAAGKTEYIVGFDGLPAALQAVKDGKVQATMIQPCFHFGMLSVYNAVMAIEGNASSIPAEQLTMPILVTQDNVDEYLNKGYYGDMG
jgi:ribose transport system substrate-binding protein